MDSSRVPPSRLRACLLLCALPFIVAGCPDAASGDGDGDAEGTAADAPNTDDGTTATTPADGSDSGTTGGADGSSGGSGSEDSDSEDSESGSTGTAACGPPVQLGVFTPTAGDARGFAVVGNTVFLAVTSAGLEAVDITDPGLPVSLGALDFDVGELAFTVAVSGDHAFVGQRGAGWKIVDITDPTMMVEVASEDTDDAEDVAVVGDTFYVVNANGIRTYDVTDRTMPTVLSPTVVLPGASKEIAIAGDTAYVAASGGGLVSVDISDPAAPLELGVFSTNGNGPHVTASGTTVYASHADGVNILDMTDPAAPGELGFYARERAHAVVVDGGTLFVLGDDTATTQVPFLAIVDVSDPSTPVELDTTYDDLDQPDTVRLDAGRLLFTAQDDDALHLVDPCPTM